MGCAVSAKVLDRVFLDVGRSPGASRSAAAPKTTPAATNGYKLPGCAAGGTLPDIGRIQSDRRDSWPVAARSSLIVTWLAWCATARSIGNGRDGHRRCRRPGAESDDFGMRTDVQQRRHA